MKRKLVEDNFLKYTQSNRVVEDISGTDKWNFDEDEENVDIDDIDNDDINLDDIEDIEFPDDEMVKAIRNELKVPEYNRRSVVFIDKRTDEKVKGVPMAQIGENAFLFKVDGKIRKFKLENIKFDY